MIYILSTDRIDKGKTSSMGGRVLQLYNACKQIDTRVVSLVISKKCFDLLMSNTAERGNELHDYNVMHYDYDDSQLYIKSTSNDVLICPINLNKPIKFKGRIVGDLIAPIITEQVMCGNYKYDVLTFLQQCDSFIVANASQRSYWIGILSMYGIVTKPIYIVPMSPMNSDNIKHNTWLHTIISYGAMYPWFDYKATIETFSKIVDVVKGTDDDMCDRRYCLYFHGVDHPLYRPKDIGLQKYIKSLPSYLRERIFIHKEWNNEEVTASAGICISKYPEYVVANRTRALTFLGAGVPIITNKGDNTYNILDEDVDSRFILHNELPPQVIVHHINHAEEHREDFMNKVNDLVGEQRVINSLRIALK
jgi:hypothetical protein